MGYAHIASEERRSAAAEDPGFIRAWRQRAGYTQEALAHALGITFSSVNRWENGHSRPSKLAWRALERLATEINVPLEVVA